MKIKIAITIEIDDGNVSVSSEDHQLLERIEAMAESQEQAVSRLTADVQSMKTVEESAKTLLQGLADQLRANQTDPAAISALADAVEAQIADLSTAVTTNTPGQSDTSGASSGSDTSGSGTGSDTSGAAPGSDTTGAGSGDGGAGADLPPPGDGSGTSGVGDVSGGAAPAGATDDSAGTSALDPTVDAGAGADATAAQAEDPAP